MTNIAAIATKLNVLQSAIVRVEEWAHVLFVVVKGLGGRFVSKKVVEVKIVELPKTINYSVPTGQQIEMIYVTVKKSYQTYVNGIFKSYVPADQVLKTISRFPADTIFTY